MSGDRAGRPAGPEVRAWPVPVLGDNYAWILARPGFPAGLVVDPGEAEPVLRALERLGLGAAGVLVTHHHADHTAGVPEVAGALGCPVFGPRREPIPGVTRPVDGGDVLPLETAGLEVTVLSVPGHTAGHVAWLAGGVVATGDTLFGGGCGRLFEGTPARMFASLSRLAALPAATRVCCGHEYTVANLRFARRVEPGNHRLEARLREAETLRERGEPTVPSTVAEERATNPFLRCSETPVVEGVARLAGRPVTPGLETFTILRRLKDAAG